jgi:ABC-type uncharacterized transport system substrate-binding protein
MIGLYLTYILLAHPHVFIDYITDFVFDQHGLTGIDTEWYFDEMYSSMIIQEYDTDQDGIFSKKEIAFMQEEAFSNLRNYHYFAYITTPEKIDPVNTVENFTAHIEHDRLVYSFFIPCRILTGTSNKTVEICFYDVTYYVDLWPLNDDPVRITGAEYIDYSSDVFEDVKQTQGYGEIYPYTVRLTFRKK